MELTVTRFFNEADHIEFSASVAECGEGVGTRTYRKACDSWEDFTVLDSTEKDEAFREHIRGYGAWSDEEIASWDDRQLNALALQFIAGDIREHAPDGVEGWDWDEYHNRAEAGDCTGRLWTDGTDVFYDIDD